MPIAVESDPRVAVIQDYFRKVDTRDPDLLDLFTDDVAFFFPKFGAGRGKAGLAGLGRRLEAWLASLDHDIPGFRYVIAGDDIVVEGTEWGMTHAGERWPDGAVSQGRFCSVFTFEGLRIRRMFIYVDPDFTSADAERIRLLRGDAEAA
ncbi:nuclear transport factor 2 family protein [Marinivivus vitaminiproducens]|uniref:nuclear transport factor 2 family protein n=1 Tax=Marinivivus vitaminiproducens TaxID=3035935 RepID=UPI002798FA26|nr:nuclear transport factor 2 family protein [Geminicoccaceae bacterium SCSIO 64248]